MQFGLNKDAILNDGLRKINGMIAIYNKVKSREEQKKFISWTNLEDIRLEEKASSYQGSIKTKAEKQNTLSAQALIVRDKVKIADGTKSYRLKLEFFVYEVYKQVMVYTPEDTGKLKDSIRVRKDRDEFIISVSTNDCPYCVTVHQNLTYGHNPPTRAKYMQLAALKVSEIYSKPYNVNIDIQETGIILRFNGPGHNLVTSNFANRQTPGNNRNNKTSEDPLDLVSFEKIWKE